ncbi:MAG: B12-binding domain-containing radical SAM protein, partial [Planctomycetota bacterium]
MEMNKDFSGGIVLVSPHNLYALGIRSIFAYLRQRGLPARFVILSYRYLRPFAGALRPVWAPVTRRDLENLLLISGQSELIGIYVLSGMFKRIARITRYLQRAGKKVIWGGPHAIADPESCFPYADFVCTADGEETIEALLKGKPLHEVPSLAYRDNGRTRYTGRKYVCDLNSLPLPDWSKEDKFWLKRSRIIPGDPLHKDIGIQAMFSRGCPHRCPFCGNNKYKSLFDEAHPGKSFFRRVTPERAIEVLEHGMKKLPQADKVLSHDENILNQEEWFDSFFEMYSRRIALPFFMNFNPSDIGTGRLKQVIPSMFEIIISVQQIERIRKRLFGRIYTDEKIRELARIAQATDTPVTYEIIIRIPGENHRDRQELLEFILSLPRPTWLNLYVLGYLPETALTRRYLNEGKIN